MRIKKSPSILASILTIFTALSSHAVETDKKLSLNSGSVDSLFIDSGAGSLEVIGQENLKKIIVDAHITVSGVDDDEANKWFKKNMTLSLEKESDTAVLKANFDEKSFFNMGWNKTRTIDLKVRIPKNLSLKVDDGSGWSKINNLNANLDIDDGSGELTISNIVGNLKVDDGSGDLNISKITGDLHVDDGSGSLVVDDIAGTVEIEDGSGSIKLTNVTKSVYIDDGSGSVYACDIDSDLTIDDGSGGVDTCNIKGELVIK